MKVEIITRHAIINYGSLLQALATQNVVECLGHEAEVIDYIRYDEHYKNREKFSINLFTKSTQEKKIIDLIKQSLIHTQYSQTFSCSV